MNRFFFVGEEGWTEVPRRLYAVLDQAEVLRGRTVRFLFDAVHAAWFDETQPTAEDAGNVRLALAELDFPSDEFLRLLCPGLAGRVLTGAPWSRRVGRLLDGAGLWFELVLGTSGPPLMVYPNLYAAPQKHALEHIRLLRPGQSRRQRKTFSLNRAWTASQQSIQNLLGGIGSIAHAIAYDVGQGSCHGLVTPRGPVGCYYDFGGGVAGHAATFPGALAQFCGCASSRPPIVLSHWDWDHWSSANRWPAALSAEWLAPLQRIGAIHWTFAQSIIAAGGRVLLWPAGLASVTSGHLTVEKCTGSGRNHSGLALVLSEHANRGGQAMLFPGDARYAAVPSGRHTYASVVAPHHGADMRSRFVPSSPRNAHSRVAYSFGAPNTYGHPTGAAQQDHHSAGWLHGNLGGRPDLRRDTSVRGSSGLGHVSLHWAARNRPPAVYCGGKHCDLAATQT